MDETDQLYAVGRGLGFSLTHVRRAIEKAENLSALLRRWEAWTREDERYLAATWPDYTSDARRRMSEEPPPVPEGLDEAQERAKWLALALGKGESRSDGKPPRKANLRVTCVVCGADSRRKRYGNFGVEPFRLVGGFRHCSDRCLLLERDGCRA
jgi:hypothetical protein